MRDLTPSHIFGSSSFIDGYFNVVNRLDLFVDSFEQQVADYISKAFLEEEESLQEKATNKWGREIADGLRIEYQDGAFVYTSDDSVSTDVANLEFGSRPSPVIRPQAIQFSRTAGEKFSSDLSAVIPSA